MNVRRELYSLHDDPFLQALTLRGSGTFCRKSGTPARQRTAKSDRPTFRNRKLYHNPLRIGVFSSSA